MIANLLKQQKIEKLRWLCDERIPLSFKLGHKSNNKLTHTKLAMNTLKGHHLSTGFLEEQRDKFCLFPLLSTFHVSVSIIRDVFLFNVLQEVDIIILHD